jgi:hypothetical protein
LDKTPLITEITPSRGTTAGNTEVTLKGQYFGTVVGDVKVTFDGVNCAVISVTATQIKCKTGARYEIFSFILKFFDINLV